MNTIDPTMNTIPLQSFIESNRDQIIGRCRAKVAERAAPPVSKTEVEHGIPLFLDQLVQVLRRGEMSDPEIAKSAVRHGSSLQLLGYTLSQVVHDYGDVCQSITDLAVEADAPISADDFRTLNKCLDDAIAGAVDEHGRGTNQAGIDQTGRAVERAAKTTRELRTLIDTGLAAFEALQTGRVGVGGSTGAVVHRSLTAARALIDRPVNDLPDGSGSHLTGAHREVPVDAPDD